MGTGVVLFVFRPVYITSFMAVQLLFLHGGFGACSNLGLQNVPSGRRMETTTQ